MRQLIVLMGVVGLVAAAGLAAVESRVLDQSPDRLIVELPNRMIVIAESIPTARS